MPAGNCMSISALFMPPPMKPYQVAPPTKNQALQEAVEAAASKRQRLPHNVRVLSTFWQPCWGCCCRSSSLSRQRMQPRWHGCKRGCKRRVNCPTALACLAGWRQHGIEQRLRQRRHSAASWGAAGWRQGHPCLNLC